MPLKTFIPTSSAFQNFVPDSPSGRLFQSHLQIFLKLQPEQGKILVEKILQHASDYHADTSADLTDDVKRTLEISKANAEAILSITGFFVKAFQEEEIDAEQEINSILADLDQMRIISDAKKKPLVKDIIQTFAAAATEVAERERPKRYTVGVLPYLKGVGTTVEMRAVLEVAFSLGDDLQAYKPQITSTVPVVSVRLSTDRDTSIVFQANLHHLRLLIDKLEATYRDMSELQKHLSEPSSE